MNELTNTREAEISKLYGEICELAKTTLDKAIRIGKLLTEQKEDLPHGQFESWIEKTLPFAVRTARNYMRLYHQRDLLKSATIADLTGAYRLLQAPKKDGAETKQTTLSINDIDPNPFFDLSQIPGTRIVFWTNAITHCDPDASLYSYPDSIMAVRKHKDRYQLVCGHDQWAALRMLQRDVMVSVVNLTDKQMKTSLAFERTGEIDLGESFVPAPEPL